MATLGGKIWELMLRVEQALMYGSVIIQDILKFYRLLMICSVKVIGKEGLHLLMRLPFPRVIAGN